MKKVIVFFSAIHVLILQSPLTLVRKRRSPAAVLACLVSLGLFMSVIPPLASAQVDTAWVKRYNGPGNIDDQAHVVAVDSSGNVYVTGYSNAGSGGGWYDYATIKYYPNGDTAWLRRYNGAGNDYDAAYDMVVDKQGNVYVTGESRVVFSENNYYVTIKYYPNGDTAWLRYYKGPGLGGNEGRKLAVDDSGNVYVTGNSDGVGTYSDYATIKYKPNGDTLWVRRYNGPSSLSDYAAAIAVDDSGNMYVAGSSSNGSYEDYATIKYYPNGDTAWVRRYNGPVGQDYLNPSAHGIVVDDSGNVYVTGTSDGGTSMYDIATVKYAPNGNTTWVRRYEGPGDDFPNDIVLDKDGYIYITGNSFNGTSEDYVTIKYTPGGDIAWAKIYNGSGNDLDRSTAMTVDDSSNVYVTGRSLGVGSGYDYATVKYNSNGDLTWVIRYNGPGNGFDRAYSIVVDDSGNVYVTGESEDSSAVRHYATIKYVQVGTTLSVSTNVNWNMVSVPLTVSDYTKTTLYPTAISNAFAYEGAYVVHTTLTNGIGYWMKFSSAQTVQMSGGFKAEDAFDVVEGWNLIGSISSTVAVSTITSIPPGLVTSEFFGYNGTYQTVESIEPGKGYWVNVSAGGTLHLSSSLLAPSAGRIRIVPTSELPPPAPHEGITNVPIEFALAQNYPNPFNPATVIQYQLPVTSFVSLKVFDLLGQEVATLLDGVQDAGYKSVQWNASGVASGVYLYKLQAGTFTDVKKLILLR